MPRCTVCASASVRPDPFFHEWKGKEYRMHRCDDCTHQFIWPGLAPEDQAAIYGDNYFAAGGDWAVGYFQGVTYLDAERQLRDEAKRILAMLPAQSGRMLDIGCAGGVFLDEARIAGFSVAGVEYNPNMAALARDRFGLDVRAGAIEHIAIDSFRAGEFTIVVMNDCIEHLPDPRAAAERIRQWTAPGSALFIRGPLLHSWRASIKESLRRAAFRVPMARARADKQLDGYPLDLNHFNRASLTRLIADQGFRVNAWLDPHETFSNMLAERVA